MLAQDYIRGGMSVDAAARAARLRLGGVAQLKEVRREISGLPLLDALAQDSRYTVRALRRSPGFTAVAVLTLGLGIGANTAVFSVVHAVLLQPLPYVQPENLLNVSQVQQADGGQATGWSYANFAEFRERNGVFSEVAGTQHHQLTLTGWGEPLAVDTSVVTPELFTMFVVQPLLGRVFWSSDGGPGAAAAVVLSEGLWRSKFGADPSVVGRSIDLDKRAFTVVGVMPAAFRFPLLSQTEQLWIPLRQDPLFGPWMVRRAGHWLQVTGRLKDGVTPAQLDAALSAFAATSSRDYPAENAGSDHSGASAPADDCRRRKACAARPAWRRRSRAAHGLRQHREPAAHQSHRPQPRTGRPGVDRCEPRPSPSSIADRERRAGVRRRPGGRADRRRGRPQPRVFGAGDGAACEPDPNRRRVLGFAAALSLGAALISGLAPSLFAAGVDLQRVLKHDGRAGESAARRRTRGVLAAGEIALALVLLTAAALVLQSFVRLTAVDPGFDPAHLLKAEVSLPRFQYSTAAQWRLFGDRLLAKVHAEPGLENTALAIPAPIADGTVNLGFEVVGEPRSSTNTANSASYVAITPEYFRVMRIPLVAGRTFDTHDNPESRRVCVISAAMARRHFGGRSPIGQSLTFGFPPDGDAAREIVGVVGDLRDVALDRDPGPMMYVPFAQAPFPGAVLLVRHLDRAR